MISKEDFIKYNISKSSLAEARDVIEDITDLDIYDDVPPASIDDLNEELRLCRESDGEYGSLICKWAIENGIEAINTREEAAEILYDFAMRELDDDEEADPETNLLLQVLEALEAGD